MDAQVEEKRMSSSQYAGVLDRGEKLKERAKARHEREDEPKSDREDSSEVLTIDDGGVKEVLNSISSETARRILASVHDSPKIPTELAEEQSMTTQNIRYHLDNLEEAGLINDCRVRYSEKGREMSVYEPSEPQVIVIGNGLTQERNP